MIDYLSYSQLSVLRRCGEQYRRRYIEGESYPTNVPLIIGSATHSGAETNLRAKITEGELLPIEAVRDAASDAFDQQVQQEIDFTDEEQAEGKDRVLGAAKDTTITAASTHAEHLAPSLYPHAVEEKLVVSTPYGVDLMAIMDVIELHPDHTTVVRDLKVRKRRPNKGEALSSFQLSFYDYVMNEAAHPIDKVAIDTIVHGTKNMQAISEVARRDDEDRRIVQNVIERSIEVIEKGAFVPTDPSNWWCSKAYCWFAPTCPFFAGRKAFAME